ncbi:MAG: GerMN domain-containing protein [Anaerolineales bacterium]
MQRTPHMMTIMLLILAVATPLSGCAPDQGEARATQTPTSSPVRATATPPATVTPQPATVTPQPTSPSPTVTIFPTSGPPGTKITVKGEGWPSNTEIQLGVGQKEASTEASYDAQITADGSFTKTLIIPKSAEPGQHWVVEGTTETSSPKIVSNAFQVVEQEYHGTVEISPHSGPPGTTVRVMGEDFPPERQVEIGVGRPRSEYDVMTMAETDEEGHIDTEITLPDFVEPGDEWVIVIAAEYRPAKAVSEVFEVTTAESTTPSPTSTVQTDIYLVAVDDDGQLGKRFGCNDSLVPVQVQIDADADPATAALNKLLSIESREHESTELYNALYQSDLSVEEVRITNGEAIVRLSGTLMLGGVCDEPRVKEQLQQTVLQYVGVQEVSIIIDDTPLEDLLGEGPPEG